MLRCTSVSSLTVCVSYPAAQSAAPAAPGHVPAPGTPLADVLTVCEDRLSDDAITVGQNSFIRQILQVSCQAARAGRGKGSVRLLHHCRAVYPARLLDRDPKRRACPGCSTVYQDPHVVDPWGTGFRARMLFFPSGSAL